MTTVYFIFLYLGELTKKNILRTHLWLALNMVVWKITMLRTYLMPKGWVEGTGHLYSLTARLNYGDFTTHCGQWQDNIGTHMPTSSHYWYTYETNVYILLLNHILPLKENITYNLWQRAYVDKFIASSIAPSFELLRQKGKTRVEEVRTSPQQESPS